MSKIYRIYTIRNMAETSRDADQIVTDDLAYRTSEEEAIAFSKQYMKDHHFRKFEGGLPELKQVKKPLKKVTGEEIKNAKYIAHDIGSWAPSLIIEEIEVA